MERDLGQGRDAGRPLAHPRLPHRAHDDVRNHVDHPQAVAEPGEPRVPSSAGGVGQLRRVHPGTNDAQKTMGIIALALIVSGHLNAEEFDVPSLGRRQRRARYGARDVRRRLADHQDDGYAHRQDRPTSGLRRANRVRRHSLDDRPPRRSRFDDADHLRARDGAARAVACRRFAGNRGTSRSPGPHPPRRRARRRADGGRDADAAGNLIVFLLAGAIAAAAFLGRRYETRRLLPAQA